MSVAISWSNKPRVILWSVLHMARDIMVSLILWSVKIRDYFIRDINFIARAVLIFLVTAGEPLSSLLITI